MAPKKKKEAGPAGCRKYSEKMKMVTQGAEERDNKAQQILRETRQVVEQANKQGGLMQVPLYPGNHQFSSMPDLTAIMPSPQNFTSYSGGGVMEIVQQQQQVAQPCPVIVRPHEGGGALRRAKSFSRPRSVSPNPAVLRPISPGRPCVGRPVSLEQRDKQKQPVAVSAQFAGSQRSSLPSNFEARRTEVLLPPAYHQNAHLPNNTFNDGSIQNDYNNSPVNGYNISPQDNHNLTNFNSSLTADGSSSHHLCLRRQTEGDIFNSSRLTHQSENERKLSEPASPIRIMISSPEDDHLQQQRSSNPTNPVTSHLFGGYRSRRNSDNPHSPGPSTPGTPGSPESDFNSNPNSPQSECQTTQELSKFLNDLIDLETPTATLVSQPENSVCMDQLPPDSDPAAVYTILSAPSTLEQISLDGAQLGNGNTAILQIQEFEEAFNMFQPK